MFVDGFSGATGVKERVSEAGDLLFVVADLVLDSVVLEGVGVGHTARESSQVW